MPIGSPTAHRRPFLLGALAAGLALATNTGVLAQGASVQVEPSTVQEGSVTLTVTGSGFSAVGNGVYVVFGPITPAPGYYMDPSIYGAFKWVSPGGADSPATAPLAADGSFATTLDVSSAFTTGAGEVDCVTTPCAVITFAAHGSPDRSQDTCTVVTFGIAAVGSPSVAASPAVTAVPSAAPASSVVPDASPDPSVDGPCAAIGAPAP